MIILPAVTRPSDVALSRWHTPRCGAYKSYRACLRWDFGFTCPFCLSHEADLNEHGIEGTGLTWIEHRHLRRDVPERTDDYSNCLYACRFCNNARGTKPIRGAEDSELLDPTTTPWADHFAARDDRLVPVSNDPDARWTHRAYHLDDPRKVAMRRNRRETVDAAWRAIKEIPSLVDALLDKAGRSDKATETRPLLSAVRRLEEQRRAAIAQLRRYQAIPLDAPLTCRCTGGATPKLPPAILAGCTTLD